MRSIMKPLLIFLLATCINLCMLNGYIRNDNNGNNVFSLMSKGEYGNALSRVESITHMEDTPEIQYGLGIILFKLQKYNEAEAALNKAIAGGDKLSEEKLSNAREIVQRCTLLNSLLN